MVKNENFITIQGWMTKLNISGNELITYAIIYGFSQDEHSVFCGSASYIAKWIGIDKRNVLEILKRLAEKGLIEKIEKTVNNVKLCDYRIIPWGGGDETSPGMMKHHRGGDETSPGGGDETSPHIYNIDNIEDKKDIYKSGGVTKPTEKEVIEYAKEQNDFAGVGGFVCTPEQAEDFFNHYESQGWLSGNGIPIHNWRNKLKEWVKEKYKQQQQAPKAIPRMSYKEIKEAENHMKLQKMLNGEL